MFLISLFLSHFRASAGRVNVTYICLKKKVIYFIYVIAVTILNERFFLEFLFCILIFYGCGIPS